MFGIERVARDGKRLEARHIFKGKNARRISIGKWEAIEFSRKFVEAGIENFPENQTDRILGKKIDASL